MLTIVNSLLRLKYIQLIVMWLEKEILDSKKLYKTAAGTSESDLSSDKSSSDAYLPLKVMEAVTDPSTAQRYNQLYAESYDISSNGLYTALYTVYGKSSKTTKGTRTKIACPSHLKT